MGTKVDSPKPSIIAHALATHAVKQLLASLADQLFRRHSKHPLGGLIDPYDTQALVVNE
jgi:hypothetical protein